MTRVVFITFDLSSFFRTSNHRLSEDAKKRKAVDLMTAVNAERHLQAQAMS
jgi:hypothetical protein